MAVSPEVASPVRSSEAAASAAADDDFDDFGDFVSALMFCLSDHVWSLGWDCKSKSITVRADLAPTRLARTAAANQPVPHIPTARLLF
eukprot:1316381-Pyramimonas_sp.AAC.1